MKQFDVVIVGGGAAGFFTAINIAEFNSNLSIAIVERGSSGLQKVKVSGGGRCNVSHAEFIPSELVTNYPRGEKELLGPFHSFMTGDTMQWFEDRGIALKIEEDGRIFPVSNDSQSVIDCFLGEAERLGVEILYNHSVKTINSSVESWHLETSKEDIAATHVVMATGSNTKVWDVLKNMGHTIVTPVPSLFTFVIKDRRIKDIPGVVAKNTQVKVLGTDLVSEGPLLITHVGMSAPAILKLSAFGAVELAEMDYNFEIEVNFVSEDFDAVMSKLKHYKLEFAKKIISRLSLFDLPKRLWSNLVKASGIEEHLRWAETNKQQLEELAIQLSAAVFKVTGKSTFKEEFVTAGGVELKEINFKNFESKYHPRLYFAGEIMNIDAITGGFNFQNAWTNGYLAAKAIAKHN